MTRLYEAAEKLKGLRSPTAVARFLNQSSQTVKNWETRGISKAGLVLAQKVIGVSATWLETGEGGPWSGQGAGTFLELDEDGSPLIRQGGAIVAGELSNPLEIPRVKILIRGGISGFQTEPDYEDGGVLRISQSELDEADVQLHNLFAAKVVGDSMSPFLNPGDTFVVDQSDRRIIHKECYALNFGNESVVKQIIRRGQELYLHSVNSDYPDENIRSKPCSIIGRVVIIPSRVVKGKF